ncbi:hypothetical protein EU538_11295 [Candidatus Thorarchaeota archaeon]|nr:MAG: hypothetical protein EU538_11295 [Candidatus Thorarchaeota archaeon]
MTTQTTESKALLKIRYAALGKAFEDIRKQRTNLLSELRNGVLDVNEYRKEIQKLVERGNEIRTNIELIEIQLGVA